jgi:hypothetical protein
MRQIKYCLGAIWLSAQSSCVIFPASDPERTEATSAVAKSAAQSLTSAVDPNSARRDPTKDWREYAGRARATAKLSAQSATVYESRVAVAQANLANVPVWSDAAIESQFRATRDARFMPDTNSFIRRPSWLYPDDGCWIRAELAAAAAAAAGLPKPYKLFSFGNLTVQTPNAPAGSVSWWYHVVPVVRAVSGEAYVFDPAIDATKPLKWKEWLLKQVRGLPDVEVTFADSGAYAPFSLAMGDVAPQKSSVVQDMQSYLSDEWWRQTELGRDPITILGYLPPWAAVTKDFNQDRKTDVLWHNAGTGATQIWYMNGVTVAGTAQVDPRYSVPGSSGWRLSGTGDFDCDGKADILWHNGDSGASVVWYMDGVTVTSQAQLDPRYPVPDRSGWQLSGTGDFNYDGKTDVLWHNGDSGASIVWYMNGVTVTNQAQLDPRYPILDSLGWSFSGVGDFNRDGKIDVLWHNGRSGASLVWYLDSVTVASQAELDRRYPVRDISDWRFDETGDFNYDGKVDILWHNGMTGATQAWFMDGLTAMNRVQTDSRYFLPDSSGWLPAGN